MEEKNITKLSFDELNLKESLLRGVFSYGFENPSAIQYSAIPILTKGKDVIAQAQSGTGKTGSFCIGLLNNLEDVKETQANFVFRHYILRDEYLNKFVQTEDSISKLFPPIREIFSPIMRFEGCSICLM